MEMACFYEAETVKLKKRVQNKMQYQSCKSHSKPKLLLKVAWGCTQAARWARKRHRV